jgi:hypothetical protein
VVWTGSIWHRTGTGREFCAPANEHSFFNTLKHNTVLPAEWNTKFHIHPKQQIALLYNLSPKNKEMTKIKISIHNLKLIRNLFSLFDLSIRIIYLVIQPIKTIMRLLFINISSRHIIIWNLLTLKINGYLKLF